MLNHIHGIIEINDSNCRGTMPRALVHGETKRQGTKHCAPTVT